MADPTGPDVARLVEHRRLDEVHTCVRPGCGKRAGVAYHVDAPTRLAGRDFTVGEFVDLCPADDLVLRDVAARAQAAGWGGPFEPLLLVLDEPDPFAELREWEPTHG